MFQRKYPFDSIPDDARKRAYELRPAEQLGPEVISWQLIGPTPTTSAFPSNWGVTSGRINTVAISPANSQIVLIGGATGGIWRSTNGGTSFSPTSDSQTDLAVQTIGFAASNSTIVYAGMGDTDGGYLGTGVLKSTDSGQTWTRINNSTLPSPAISAKIEVDPTNPNRVYLAQYAQLIGSQVFTSGFYLSTDGGVNWTKTLAGLPRDLVLNPANSQTLYLGMSRLDDGSLPGLYRSTNGGSNWTRIYNSPYDANGTYDVAVAVTPANSQIIYVYTGGVLSGSFETRVEVSTNGGSTWTNRGSGILDREQFGYNTYVYVDPTNANTVYVGTRDVFKSVNGGVSWSNLTNNFNTAGQYTPGSSNTHPDQHSFVFQSGSSSTFYIGNDGGIWKTTNSGTSFSNLNSSLSLTMFVGYAIHPTNPAISYGGTQDNGTQRRLATPGQWQEFSAGDGGNCVINVLNPSTLFSTYVKGSITRWTNNGIPPADATVGTNAIFGEAPYPGGRISFYAPLTGNGINSNLYFGTWRLFISTNLGNSWIAPAGTFDLTKGITASGPDVLSAIGASRSNTNVIYTGSAQGRAMVSTNGGTSWTDVTTGLPNRSITAITVDPVNSAKAYLMVSGFATGHVFSTINSGASWTNISGNLPDIPVNTLLIDPLNTNTLYVGTDIGVFQSTNGGSTWAGFNGGLPPVIVHRLVAQSTGLIQAATYGRGAFELTNGGTTTHTLTVASSNPSSGVSITVSPNDNNGQGSGVTQFARTYNNNIVVNLTAPSTAGGNNFQKWQRDGVDLTTSASTNVTMDDNHTMTAVYLGSQQPDLTITALTAPTTGAIGGQITVATTVVNQGAAAAGAFRVGFYLSTDNVITTGDTFTGWGCTYPSGLAAGASTSCDGPVGIPSSLPPGTYFFGAIADDLGAVAESNEANNSRAADTGPIVLTSQGQGTCASPYTIVRGHPFDGNTSGGQSVFGSYSCVGWSESGPERVHTVTMSSSGTLTASLSNLGGNDLDVFILSSCSSGSCLAFGDNTASANVGPGTYYILVDGFQGAVGGYTLTVGNTAFDFDGDGKSDVGVFRPTTGTWFIINSSNGSQTVMGWGQNGDKPVAADYDGDGKTDIAIWRPSTGVWWIRNSSNGSTTTVGWGVSSDVPVPADYDGDGKTDIAVWRPATGTWFIIKSSTGSPTTVVWGTTGDKVAPADYDGDGKADVAVFRPSTGTWFIINSSNSSTTNVGWGQNGDIPVAADYDGDGKTDIAIWRPSTGVWWIRKSSNSSTSTVGWGISTDVPVPADYDGDGKSDNSVWRSAGGAWLIINSSNGSPITVVWGSVGDIPISARS